MARQALRGKIGNYTRAKLDQIIRENSAAATGDITSVVAGTGLSGGATSGDATVNLDVSELSALGTTAETSDFVVIQDATDNSTKKVLISNLPGGTIDIDSFSALGGTGLHQTEDHFLFSDNGTEKKITFSNLQDAIFADVSGDATIAAAGSLTIANDAVESGMLNDNVISGQAALAGATAHLTEDHLLYSDNGVLKKILFEDLQNSIFANISGDATVAASGSLTIADGAVENDMLAGSITASKMANEIFADLEALGSVGADGNFIVANASGSFVYENGNTARTSLGLGTGDSPQFTGVTLTGTGSVQGDLTISGHLTVNGTTTTVNSTEVTVVDKALVLASGSSNSNIASAGGSGLKFGDEAGAGLVASMLYDGADSFDFTDHVNVATGQGYQINGATIIQETANFLVITGSANGIALSGSSVNLDGNLSASVNISGSEVYATEYYGDGSKLTGVTGSVSAIANGADDRLVTFSSATALNGEANLTFDSSNLLTVLGNITASVNVSGSEFYAEEYYGDGSKLTGVTGTISAVANGVDNRLATFSSADALNGESKLTFDGTRLTLSASLDIGGVDEPTINFGLGSGATPAMIKFDNRNDASEYLIISGSGLGGTVISGSKIVFAPKQQTYGVIFQSGDVNVFDDVKLNFGTLNESFIKYDEAGDDFMVISGSAKGIALSGSSVNLDGNLSASINISASAFYGDGSELSGIAGTITALNNQAANRLVTIGATTTELDGEANLTYDGTTFVINDDARINDDLPLYFGTENDAYIKYNEAADNFLIISGSGNGIALSGSMITLAGFAMLGAGGQILDEQKLHFGNHQDAFIRYSDPGVLDDFLTISGSASGMVLSGSTVKVDGNLVMGPASASMNITASGFVGDGSQLTNVPIDLNSLAAAVVNVANDSIAFIDADGSNISKKESIADFVGAIEGDGLQTTAGVINIDVSDFAGKGLKDDGSENLDIDVSDSTLTTDTAISSGDLLLFSDESETDDPTKNITVDNLFKSGSAFVAEDAPNVASDYALFLKGGASGEMIKESIADFIGAIAGTGIGSSAGQLTHPITAVNTKANDRLVTIGNTTSELDGEANLTFANSQILTLSGTMVVSASANHLKVRTSDTDFATLSVASSGHTTLQVTGTTGANAGFTVDAPGTVKLDSGNGEVRIEKDSQGMLLFQGNGTEYISIVPTGSNTHVDLNFNNTANNKQIATVSSSIDTFLLKQNIAFSSPIPLIHPTIQGGSSGNSTQAFSSGAGSIFYMFSGTGTGDHLTGTLPNPVAIGQKCIVVAHSPNSNSDAVVSYLGQSEISSSAMALKTLRSESDKPAATLFFSTQLYNSDGSPGSVVWAPLEVGAESAGGTGDIEGVTAGTGLSGGGSSGTVSLALDLADVIATDAANRLLTSDGDGSLTAEANITYDGSTFTVDDDMMIKDDHKLFFGTNSDSFIEYNENGDDYMTISGSGNGIVLSGSTIQIAGTLEGASPLRIAGEVQFVNQGAGTAFKFGPNGEANLHFGTDNYLTIKGSEAKGTVLSGSAVEVQTTNGLGVFVAGDDITHAITLPNSNQANRGKIKANAFVSYSSARYKDNIETLNDPMTVLNQINGVSFNWKDTGDLDYGFIAEDVGKVLPSIVSWEDNKKDAQGMDYLKIISFLVEATKKQQQEIDELKQKLIKQD